MLLFLKRFVKDQNFSVDMLACISPEVTDFWLKQISVNNKALKETSLKVWKAIETKLGQEKPDSEGNEIVLNFLQHMKQKGVCRFKSNSGMARNILAQLSSE